jgi:hypothetical protein
MTITTRQIRLIKVACRALGLTDEEYRASLVHLAGVESSTQLDHAGFEALMGFFEWKGFKPLVAKGPSYGNRPGMASFAQIELIRAVWVEYTQGKGDEGSLNKWLERCFKVSSLRFVTKEAAPKAITALKAMKARAAA